MKKTTIVNFFGGPCVGKSTLAAGVFYELKKRQISCELVTEYAKDLTYEERINTLKCQPYVFGTQLYRIERLVNKVDFIITDSPLYLGIFYASEKYPKSFIQSVIDISNSFDNLNYLILRDDRNYDVSGRKESLQESIEIDRKIQLFLIQNNIPHKNLQKEYKSINNVLFDIDLLIKYE